jgi:toxin ParE1/3/4
VTIRWTERALADLQEIGDHIAADDRQAASVWVARLWSRAADVQDFPFAGRMVPEFGRADIREVLLRHYRIIYRVDGAEIVVLAVFGGGQLVTPLDPDAG